MAVIEKRGKSYRARVRLKGRPDQSRTFPTKAQAAQWALEAEAVAQNRAPKTLADGLKRFSEEVAPLPAHKRLENAPPGCGIPIGNLSSQFFANVYLNDLDQFVKHVLKVRRYVRYVDDFVLIGDSREQLAMWRDQIEAFLSERLRLEFKPGHAITPLSQGVDFLGYVVFPTHVRVRPRVVAHARSKLNAWQRRHVSAEGLHITPEDYQQITSIDASYQGHFRHANSHRLQRDLVRRFPWLLATRVRRRFDRRLDGRTVFVPSRRRPQ
jgi:RNA-directed DNA polymerase